MTNLKRDALIESLATQGITNKRVLQAMSKVPRDQFIPTQQRAHAYEDRALSIECEQTISQPYIVAYMTQLILKNKPVIKDCKILEIGTGSGYQTAILWQLTKNIYTIERIESLYLKAKQLLKKLHYDSIHFLYADGALGWPNTETFDGIMVTAATDSIPKALLKQLSKNQGTMVIPMGSAHTQNLVVITRIGDHYHQEIIDQVRFVPLQSGVE